MKKLLTSIILIATLTGCFYNVSQYQSLHNAFLAGCKYDTIQSSLTNDSNTITLTANCTKAK